jgi:hypothetical protein
MNEQEIRAKIAEAPVGDPEHDHFAYDELVTDVLKYIASGGIHASAIAEEMLRREPPTKWGWYA